MYERALYGYEKALRPDHTSTLLTVDNLGILYGEHGKLAEAEKMFERAVQGIQEGTGTRSSPRFYPRTQYHGETRRLVC
jgi:hypothetical protein